MSQLLYWGYLLWLAAGVVVCVGMAGWIRRLDPDRAARIYLGLLSFTALWVVALLLVVVVPDTGTKVALYHFRFVFIMAAMFSWVLFALSFTGREHWLTRRVSVGIGAAYLLTVGAVLTNPWHGAVWSTLRVVDVGGTSSVEAVRAPVFWAVYAVIYGCVLTGLALIARLLLVSRGGSRRQFGLLAVATLPPIALNLAENLSVIPSRGFKWAPTGGVVFVVVCGWALYRHELFAVEPLARDEVLDSVEDGIVTVDDEFRIVDYNDAAVDLFPGVEGAFGESLEAHVEGVRDDADRFVDRLGVFQDGQRREISVDHSPVTDAGDRVRGYTVLFRDVTELETYARDLEQQTEQLDRFASTVAHDLRNPLSVARGYADALAERTGADEADEIRVSLDRMERLIDDSLTLAREGQAIDEPELVDLGRVAADAWETSDTDPASLAVETDGTSVYADPERLQTMLENLFRNAVDHGPDDVTVTVGVLGDGAPGAAATGFYVADDGPGIPPDERDAVFEYGYTTSDDGTGLGLSIVESIVGAHGWDVAVEESDSGGARFAVSGLDPVEHGTAATDD